MYKVFFKNKCIHFCENHSAPTLPFDLEKLSASELWDYVLAYESTNVYLQHPDLELIWQKFTSHFSCIEASGGLVLHNESVLLIFRLGLWDLPKGKVEPNESTEDAALREVGEECGLRNLVLGKKIGITYHIYPDKEKMVLKPTHWYHMQCREWQPLTPQTEEGITHAEWKPISSIDEVYKNTYANIEWVLKTGLSLR